MAQKKQKTSRPVFDSEDIGQLENLLSGNMNAGSEHIRQARKPFKVILTAFIVLILIVIGAGAGGFFLLKSGFEGERLNAQAQQTIQSLLGSSLVSKLGYTKLSLDSSMFLAIEAGDVSIGNRPGGATVGTAGMVQLGIDPISVLSGKIELRSARISNARLDLAGLPNSNQSGFIPSIRDAAGRIDPNRFPDALYGSLSGFFDLLKTGATRSLEAENIQIDLPGRNAAVTVSSAVLTRQGEGKLTLQALLSIDGTAVQLSGRTERDPDSGRIVALEVEAKNLPLGLFAGTGDSNDLSGLATVAVSGKESETGSADRFDIAATMPQLTVPLGQNRSTSGSGRIRMSVTEGDDKIEVEDVRLELGNNKFEFHGAFGPTPDFKAGNPKYRFELVSDGSTLSPSDSPEAPLSILARIAGTYDSDTYHLSIDDIGIRTNGGEVLGTASVAFDKPVPAVFLAIRVPRLPVSHAKQIWPEIAAPTSRTWVLDNVFGGTVRDSKLEFSVSAGRLGNSEPLSAEEVFGYFQLDGTRFDSAGEIPPVRDAFGTVAFEGTDVDIALSQGTAFLPSGRNVAATDGTLKIRKAHLRPVIGKLDIKIAGDAAAVAELSEFKPFDALRDLEFGPDDLSGQVTGSIFSEVPLSRTENPRQLDWRVELDYQDLSIAAPIDGHLVSQAEGTLVVTPDKALIKADTRLDGARASVDLVEPIGASDVRRKRRVVVELDDKHRTEILPGLDTILSGPVSVELNADLEEDQTISADLTGAVLKLPWIGWQKGKGIPAKASFVLNREEEKWTLSDFQLRGDSFSADGTMRIEGGQLAKAALRNIGLNRDDDFDVTIEGGKQGYSVRISGTQFDMRSLVKLYSGDFKKAAKLVVATPISVIADVKKARGHNGEFLNDLGFEYRGTGTEIEKLKIAAVTDSGSRFFFLLDERDANRSLKMDSADAGSVLRFLDLYARMQGGTIDVNMKANGDDPLRGTVDASDFWLVDEPRLSSIVSTKPQAGDRDLNSTVRGGLDVAKVYFDRGFTNIEIGTGYARLDRGILRGPTIGTSFRGMLYDQNGDISIAGTFMPAYGLNSIFSGIPLVGQILGNGREGGLLGITFKLAGKVNSPNISVNPISMIAPGVFRSVFEFR